MRKVRDKGSSINSLAILLWARRLWISRLTWLLLWGRGREKFAFSERRRIGFELFFHLWQKNFGAWAVKIYRHGLYLNSQCLFLRRKWDSFLRLLSQRLGPHYKSSWARYQTLARYLLWSAQSTLRSILHILAAPNDIHQVKFEVRAENLQFGLIITGIRWIAFLWWAFLLFARKTTRDAPVYIFLPKILLLCGYAERSRAKSMLFLIESTRFVTVRSEVIWITFS